MSLQLFARTPIHLGQMLDVFEQQCRVQTCTTFAATNDGAVYEESAEGDDRVPRGEILSFFHSQILPRASLRTLAASMVRARVDVDLTTISIAVVLMLRYNARQLAQPVTAHMMHRLLVLCVLVGAKAHQDRFPGNKLLGTIVGVRLSEMNRIEVTLITALDWRLVVTQQDVINATVSLTPPPSNCDAASLAESVSRDSLYVPGDALTPLLPWHAVGSSSE